MQALQAAKLTLVRIVSVFIFVCVLSASASAYTVVMRGGRRVEIPARFVVTTTTLTYEVSPGLQVTINVAAIDIQETEKVNNEVPGSLLQRIHGSAIDSRPSADVRAQPLPRRTITNSDLETSVRRRHQSEVAYEQRRKELGLPSVEESRRQAAAESASIGSELEQTRASERDSESYWRARASALRTEIAALDAELSYVRRQLDEPFYAGISTSFANLGGGIPLVSFGGISHGPSSQTVRRPQVFGSPRSSAQAIGRIPFGGGATRGQVLVNPGRFPRARPFGSQWVAPAVFGTGYDFSYERSVLITRFNELSAARAGLNARWRELEDEARRAGAPPGWLRR
jgi:hypothetical protein